MNHQHDLEAHFSGKIPYMQNIINLRASLFNSYRDQIVTDIGCL